MKCITNAECERWLLDRGVPDAKEGLMLRFGRAPAFAVPVDSGKRTYIARVIAEAITDRAALLWITGWGVWPSSENMGLFNRVRASIAETRKLHEANGHLCGKGDGEILECLLDCALYFSWDAWLVDDTAQSAVWMTNDEVVVFGEENQSHTGPWRGVSASLKLRPL